MSDKKKDCTRQVDCANPNDTCTDCCAIFTDDELREGFGYQEDLATCECHDIVVQDVRAICAKVISADIGIPGVDNVIGCRGAQQVNGTPVLDSCRIFCAEECLQTSAPNQCLVVHNEIGLEFVLRLDVEPEPVYLVIREIITEECTFEEFAAFPTGAVFTEEEFMDMVKLIDGSSKTLIIENCEILNTTNPRIHVDVKLVDKLWKYENILVSALRPYPDNITVTQEFNASHKIGACPGGPCDQTP